MMANAENIRPLADIQDGFTIHPDTHLGSVTLRVADLQRSTAFYTQIVGLHVLSQADGSAAFGTGSTPILHLREVPGARPAVRRATGLYHAAILLPTRRALASTVLHLYQSGIQFGQADHLVSEAFYINDPDGNGLEIYRDRPRSEWGWEQGLVRMDNAPINFDTLMAELNGDESWHGMPEGTVLGHIHLQIGDLDKTEAFYGGVLGFDVVARWNGALFMSAGGYHHHLGLNTWNSRNAPPAPADAAGLDEFSIVLPTQAAFDEVVHRVQIAHGQVQAAPDGVGVYVTDPFQNRILLRVGG
jgi:catechol 2,3-dioxygenase